jgi:DNA-binding response OmpR family regulator
MKHFDLLIVDDEQRYAEMLARRLTLRGVACEVCHDGGSAVALLEERPFRLVLLDLRLPDIYGVEVLQRIKNTRPDTVVIILTGHGSEADRRRCMEGGALAFLHKPLDIDRLMAVMAKIKEVPA